MSASNTECENVPAFAVRANPNAPMATGHWKNGAVGQRTITAVTAFSQSAKNLCRHG